MERSPLLAQITNTAILLAVVCVAIAGFVLFIKAVVPGCEGSSVARYEPFASNNSTLLSGAKNRIDRIRAIKDQLEADLESLSTSADDVCAILKQVEDAYVQNSAAPSSEDEYSLPKDVQERRMADRRRRAVIGFKDRQKQYVALNGGTPLYECFEGGEPSDAEVAAVLDDLNVEVKELTVVMDTAELKMATVKGDQIRSLLGFNAGYLKKAMGGITAPAGKEGFADGSKLFAKADELIGKALALHTMVVSLRRDVELQQRAAGGIDKKAGDLSQGTITEGDKAAAVARGGRPS
jgi:hypothetical protein